MSMRLIIRIQDQYATLSPGEQRLASYILDHERLIVGLSATELSRAAGVSKSAATRFFRALGYESFEVVRQQAREELNRIDPAAGNGANRASPRPDTAEAYLSREVADLTRTLEGVPSDALRAGVTTLAAASCLWIAGLAEDDVLARLALQLIGPLRPNVRMVCDATLPIENQIASFRPKDALLLFGLASRDRWFDLIAGQAVLGELDIIHITDRLRPGIAGARLTIRCPAQIDDESRRITGVVSLVGLLAERVAAHLGPRADRRRKLIASLREEG